LIIHRDIKAANILVNQGVCKLADFGESKQIMKDEETGSFKGTPYWMAPEVVKGKGYGRYADIWSLGCTVYEMCMNQPPWKELNQLAALNKIANSTELPKFPEWVSPLLADFME
jgi:serine/threonine protein kinase